MSATVLARKWRPKSFDTLVGQDHVVRALRHALQTRRLHHAYLLTGTRGVGKTTLARILAKSLNCLANDGPSEFACGQCDACRAIDAGRYVDYIEIDAASNRGVNEITPMLEQAVYAPTEGRYKVYVVDEVHMLSNHAFNAMLKTLEEPPAHVIFVLATTDPQRIPVTVLSRCLQFNLRSLPPDVVAAHLREVLQAESIAFELGAIHDLSKAARGSMRDALSLTDQAIAFGGGAVLDEIVRTMLGLLDARACVPVLAKLAVADGPGLIAALDEVLATGAAPEQVLADLAAWFHRIALAQTLPEILDERDSDREFLLEMAGLYSPQAVQLHYQIALLARRDLGLAPDPEAGLAMAVLRMLAFAPADLATPGVPRSPGSAPSVSSARPPRVMVPTGRAATATEAVQVATLTDNGAPTTAAPPDAGVDSTGSARERALSQLRQKQGQSSAGASAAKPPVSRVPQGMARTASGGDSASSPRALRSADPGESKRTGNTTAVDTLTASSAVAVSAPPLELAEVPEVKSEAVAGFTDLSPPPPRVADNDLSPSVPPKSDALDWPALAESLTVGGLVRQLARQSALVAFDGGTEGATLRLRVANRSLAEGATPVRLRDALTQALGRPVELLVDVGEPGGETAVARAQAELVRRQQQAQQAIRDDAVLQQLLTTFGAEIDPNSVTPAEPRSGVS